MTWIVAGNTPFSPFMAGDVRVTFPGGVWRDCLLKIHPVALSVVGGFSGSVIAGFELLHVIRIRFGTEQRGLRIAALDWMPRVMRVAFSGLPTVEQKLRCSLMFIGLHPTRDVIPNSGIAEPETFRFSSPKFEPERAHSYAGFFAIGSGNDVEAYRREASSAAGSGYLKDTYRAFGWTGPAQMLADRLQRVVGSSPTSTVSPFFVYAAVSRAGPVIEPHNYTERIGDGPEREVKVPPVARTYAEYLDYCRREGLGTAEAVAGGVCPGCLAEIERRLADRAPRGAAVGRARV
jgi:hypothetical protein